MLRGIVDKVCSFENCNRPHKGHGLCAGHLWQSKNKKELTELADKSGGICLIDNCNNKSRARKVCGNHYKQAVYRGEYTEKLCSILSCERKSFKNGYCTKHHHISYTYNLTAEQYEDILQKQESKCAICGTVNSINKRVGGLFIDHDHDTNIVRGLLCHQCNAGLGYFKDNVNLLNNAINYLTEE